MSAEYLDIQPNDDCLFDNIPRKSLVTYITLTNTSHKRVIFKIKTTSPRSYVVKPNHGIIPPKQNVKIEFTMQPTEGLPSDSNSGDKFMIMATDIDENFDRLNDVWREKPKHAVQENKVRVLFKGVEPPPERRSVGYHKTENSTGATPDKMRYSQNLKHGQGNENQMFLSTVSQKGGGDNGLGLSQFGKDYKKEFERVSSKLEDQERLIVKITQERDSLSHELINLKQNLANKMSGKPVAGFQFWHMLIVCIISLIIGAFLSA